MTADAHDYFLFVGAADSESATTRLRAGGLVYRKKLLSSRPENWSAIVSLVTAPTNRGTLLVLTGGAYAMICQEKYWDVAQNLLDGLVDRPHIIFVHEAVFLTDAQREAAAAEQVNRANLVQVNPRFTEDDYFGMPREEFFGSIPDDLRQRVNSMLRERGLNVAPYRTNVERSILASSFLEDNESQLLFRVYVPSGRLYAQEAEALLGLFRDWLAQTGRRGVRQEGYSTTAGQIIEFFNNEESMQVELTQSFQDFSSFLERCVSSPEVAVGQLTERGLDERAASTLVSRFAIRARRLSLDLRQRREERMLLLKHEFENVMLETDGLHGGALSALLEELLPPPLASGVLGAGQGPVPAALTVNNYNAQYISEVAGHVVQNVSGTVHLSVEAKQLLDFAAAFGGTERGLLETSIHELEDQEAPSTDRVAARSRIKRFLADLGNRGLGVGVEVLQKYVEHRFGLA
jgi:hypothetical protein